MSDYLWPQRSGQPLPPETPSQVATGQRRRARWPRRGTIVAGATVAAVIAGAGFGYAFGANQPAPAGRETTAELSVAQVEAKVRPAIVDVVSTLDYGAGEAAGTGIVLTPSGEVLTNNHVVEGATSISVTDVGNAKTYAATVLGYDLTNDVALLQLKGASGLQTTTLGNSSTVEVGQGVVALGNAGGEGGTPASATGTVTALDQSITAYDDATGSSEQLTGLIETDAPIQPGDSGGPLVNMRGEVIGMDTAASASYQFEPSFGQGQAGGEQGYAIPVNQALSVAREIEAGLRSADVHVGPSAFLGVRVAPTSAFVGFGAMTGGVAVAGVVAGSPAAKAGLAAADTITSVGGHTVASPSILRSLLTHYYPGQKVSVTWVDGFGTPQSATLVLSSGPVG
jgi:S1-C subfamily serine protease